MAERIASARSADKTAHHDILGLMTKAKETNPYMTDRIIGRTLMQFFTDGYAIKVHMKKPSLQKYLFLQI